MRYFRETETLNRVLVVFAILGIITSWLNGSLLGICFWDGPYWGRVTEADTDKPLAGASVAGIWRFQVAMNPVFGCHVFADARETVTDKRGYFFLSPARIFWLWPFSRIELDEIVVFKPGYDSHPPGMYGAWTGEDKEEWRIRLSHKNPEYDPKAGVKWNYDQVFYKSREKCEMYKPTIIRLNKLESKEERRRAVAVPLGEISQGKRYRVRKMIEVVNREEEKLYGTTEGGWK